MTEIPRYRVNHTQRSLSKIMLALAVLADHEEAVGDRQEALYCRFLRATLMNGVLQDEPTETKP